MTAKAVITGARHFPKSIPFKVYYADGRTGNVLSTGGSDILLGYFDTTLTDDCLMDAGISTSVENYSSSPITITATNVTLSSPTENINLLAQTYNIEPLCDTSLCPPTNPEIVPTLNEWGLMILGLMLLIMAVVGIKQQKQILTAASFR